ncbi:MAG: large conductance mechanosensitive channel protein MscL [Acutalibacteraceae bacterium]
MKKFFQEFKEFAMRGNVIDLAVGVIIGAAFQKIVSSLVDDIISPVIGLFAKTDLSALVVNVFGVDIRYGSFLTAIINFIIMAFVIFVIVKTLNKLASLGKHKEDPKAPATKKCPFCQSEIDIKAVRCPHCTSVLEDANDEKKDEKETAAASK